MIPRYTPTDFAELWAHGRRFQVWLDVELAVAKTMENAGIVPQGTVAAIQPVRSQLDPARIDEIERISRHDVIAFLTHVEELAGPPARWLHFGMTSSDVLDTSLAVLLRDAADMLIERVEKVLQALSARVKEHRHTPMMGRSHGIHAEPITLGLVLAGHYAEIQRGRQRLKSARNIIAVGKIAGAVGTYAHLDPSLEKTALAHLGLEPETVSTQIVARDRHAEFACALALVAAGIERFAINVRHWQRTEVREAEEAFGKGQKGSSAMPHKRNPVWSENLCGLARVVRTYVGTALEDIGLWHERDISHSSAERMMFPDTTSTLAFMLDRVHGLIQNLVVYPDRMIANLEKTGHLWASEGVLLELTRSGLPRQEAYVLVQRNAMKAIEGEGDFQSLLLDDADVTKHVDAKVIQAQFDLNVALRHIDAIIDRALA